MDIEEVLKRLEAEAPDPVEDDEDLLRAYGVLGSDDLKAMRGDNTERGKKMVIYLQMIHIHPDVPEPYFKLGHMLGRDEPIRLRNREVVCRRDLWALGIKHDPTNAKAYYNIARDLRDPVKDFIVLPDGRTMNAQDLCVEAIRHKLDYAECYYFLSKLLPNAEAKVMLYNGREATRRELQIDAVSCDKTLFQVYNTLAYEMEVDDVIFIDGERKMQRDLYALAIHYGPHDVRAYVNLGALMESGSSIKLPDGSKLSQQGMYIEALAREPDHVVALHNLAITMSSTDCVPTKDGQKWTRRELLLRCLELDPKYKKAYNALAYDLKKKETILLRGPDDDFDDEPTRRTKKALYNFGGTVFLLPVGMEDDDDHAVELAKIETPPNELNKRRRRRRRLADGTVAPRKPKKAPELAPGTRERLVRFFECHAPEKLEEVDKLLPLLAGREESRFLVLVEIYGPEPPDPSASVRINDGSDDLMDIDALLPPMPTSSTQRSRNDAQQARSATPDAPLPMGGMQGQGKYGVGMDMYDFGAPSAAGADDAGYPMLSFQHEPAARRSGGTGLDSYW